MTHRERLTIPTPGRATLEITSEVAAVVARAKIAEGTAHVFVHHTSASLMINENADPSVQRDTERFLADLAPDGDVRYEHDAEGPDDMPAHLRSILLGFDVTIPIAQGRLDLGTWQGLFLYEHRHEAHQRRLTVTVSAL